MPIPPRPIPSHARANRRPGRSVPRKLASTLAVNNNLDWRAEVALLSELGPGSETAAGARSLPVSKLSTVSGIQLDKHSKHRQGKTDAEEDGGDVGDIGGGRREVQLEGLIADSRGKREKRATTATTLGFDFIPNPFVLALPDDAPSPASSPSKQTKSSLLSITKSATPLPLPLTSTSGSREGSALSPSPALSGTPQTPALLAQSGSDGEVEEGEDDDWEHIPSLSAAICAASRPEGQEEEADDGDVIVLGELEFEEELNKLDLAHKGLAAPSAFSSSKGKGAAKGKTSYAAALGAGSAHTQA